MTDQMHESFPEPSPVQDHTDPPTLDQTDFKGASIRMKGIVDEISAFQRTFRNAKKVTGQ